MECNITHEGIPTATFGWDKNGYPISGDKIIKNSTLFALKLSNLTMEDAGMYTCIARNTVSYKNDHIELRVTQPGKNSYNHVMIHAAVDTYIVQIRFLVIP